MKTSNRHPETQFRQFSLVATHISLWDIYRQSDREIVDTLAAWRWGLLDKQICPKCGLVESHIWRVRKQAWRCKSCAAEFSVTSGTPFANHHISLRTIAKGIVLFINSEHSISASSLMMELGISANTARRLRANLREAQTISHLRTRNVELKQQKITLGEVRRKREGKL